MTSINGKRPYGNNPCLATNRMGTPCQRPAGWGTIHPGIGRCKLHGGASPRANDSAMRTIAADAAATYGLPIITDPFTALEDELHRTAGHVQWLSVVVASLDAATSMASGADTIGADGRLSPGPVVAVEGLFDFGRAPGGVLMRQPSVWLELYDRERKHLRAVAETCIRVGLDAKRVELIRSSGVRMIAMFQRVLADPRLALSPEQLGAIPGLIREHVAIEQLDGGASPYFGATVTERSEPPQSRGDGGDAGGTDNE